MKISMINGSPKAGNSISGLLLEYLMPFMEGNEVAIYDVCKADFSVIQFSQILSSEVLIFAFPLYVDSINSCLLRFLAALENRGFRNDNIVVYCMINNGFYEGWQNRVAAEIMQNWCKAAGLTYGQTLGIGAGEMLPFLNDVPLGHGPNKNLGIALQEFSRNIVSLNPAEDLFISPNLPRFFWKIASTFSFWYPQAKKNGVKRRRLKEKADCRKSAH